MAHQKRKPRWVRSLRWATTATAILLALLGVAALSAQELSGPGGARLTGSELASGQHVFVFYASWSPKCRDITARTRQIVDRFGGRARVWLVNFQEDAGTASGFLGGSAPAPLLLDSDGSFARRHSVLNLPGLVVYKNGEAVYSGPLPADAASLLDSLLD